MIFKYMAFILFPALFSVIAVAIIGDMVRERKKLDAKRKPRQSSIGYIPNNQSRAGGTHRENIVPMRKSTKSTKKGSRREK